MDKPPLQVKRIKKRIPTILDDWDWLRILFWFWLIVFPIYLFYVLAAIGPIPDPISAAIGEIKSLYHWSSAERGPPPQWSYNLTDASLMVLIFGTFVYTTGLVVLKGIEGTYIEVYKSGLLHYLEKLWNYIISIIIFSIIAEFIVLSCFVLFIPGIELFWFALIIIAGLILFFFIFG